MVELPKRKRLRLEGYDYSRGGAYFITICTSNRKEILSEIVGDDDHGVPKTSLSYYGKMVDQYINSIETAYQNIIVEKYIIMPNHVHIVILIQQPENGTPWSSSPTDIPKIISTFKHLTNKSCGFSMWQSHYYDHIIRDEEDYLRVCQYIDENPFKWLDDEYYQGC